MLAHEIRNRYPPIPVQLQETAIRVKIKRHVVCRLRERILAVQMVVEARQEFRTARIERRQMQRTQGVEFRVSGRLDDRTKMRRNGHPSLRIDPVRHMSEEPVQNATPPF